MTAALKRPTLDELYKRLRDYDYTQVDERLAVTLNAILQLEAYCELGKRRQTPQREYPIKSRPDSYPGTWMEA